MRVVITVRDDPERHKSELKQYGRIIHVSKRARSIIADVPDYETVKKIAQLPFVSQVAVDKPFKPQSTCTTAPPSRITNAHARSLMGAEKPFEPTAVRVAVIDTGIAETDKINVIKRIQLIDEPTDDKNHGTWVAHTIAGYPVQTNVGTIEGVLPGNPIIDAPVINKDGYTTMSDILMALDAVADEGATVINMSLSSPTLCTEATNNMMESLAKEGIIMVVAGGNFGNDRFIGCPANSPHTIAVGSVYFCPPRTFPVSEFSPKGPDFVAIGGNTNPEQLIAGLGANYPIAMAGTSMATPFVTGAATVIKNYLPQADVGTARLILATSSTKSETVPDPYTGYGMLNYKGILDASTSGELPESPYYPQTIVETISIENLLKLTAGGVLLWLLMNRGFQSSKVASRY